MTNPRSIRRRVTVGLLGLALFQGPAWADISLADSPLFSTVSVPGNLILALSVEWPTATTPAYPSTTAYTPASTFYGYFDPAKCYQYVYDATTPSSSYFQPYGAASSHACSSSASLPLWSGNYLNWASMQTLDAFRWVLTGGYRSVDTTTSTVLTKTYAAQDSGVMPQKTVTTSYLAGATPFTSTAWTAGATTRVRFLGTRMWITGSNTGSSGTGTAGSATSGATAYNGHNSYVASSSSSYANPATTYELYVNVKVCDSSVGVEDNCVGYSGNYKPEGLMQAYSSKLRYAAFGYLNHSGTYSQQRDGGVMRARLKYIGPTRPVPGSSSLTNSYAEWSGSTGVMATNPDPDDATATGTFAATAGWSGITITNSGVMNYLNKFGYSAQSYKSKDPVSELYYAALRYYKNLGNVASYTTLSGAGSAATASTWLDGFPAITGDDVWKKSISSDTAYYGSPMLYSCQKNFILGIGDVNTHQDANLPGSALTTSTIDNTAPSEVSSDTTVSVATATNMVGKLEGYSGSLGAIYQSTGNSTCLNGSAYNSASYYCSTHYIAGLAYDAHTKDIRSDLSGTQTVNTYWMDVLENQVYKHKNQYWLAAKYGGFTVPSGFSPYAGSNGTGTLDDTTWTTNTDTLTVGTTALAYTTDGSSQNTVGGADKRPDNYFVGNQPDVMKTGLTKAFAKIVTETSSANSTALSFVTPNESSSGAINYASTYNPSNWSGSLVASTVVYDASGNPTLTDLWNARDVLTATSASNRKIVTCCNGGAGLAFTYSALSSANAAGTLSGRNYFAAFSNVPGVASGAQSAANFIGYLRGDRTNEIGNGGVYRTRSYLLGDIVNAKLAAVGAPNAPYYEASNPGYAAFSRSYASRKTVVYAGANDGLLHAFDGSTGASTSGSELFAYVPSFVYGTASTYATAGLAALGNPSYSHHYYLDATPNVFDIDFERVGGTTTGTAHDWRSVLIGGLGKGGKGYYAIDVTNPTAWTSESAVAGKVLWEFTADTMGYSYGDARVVKTAKYGWTVILSSGYNAPDGKGYFYFVNPKTGALLETVATTAGSASSPINLTHLTAFVPDQTDYTADAVYGADLQGNVWRVDLTGTSGSYSATLIAQLTDPSGTAQPVTTPIRVMVDPSSSKRYLLLGTGRLLDDSDISSTQVQSFYAIVDGTKSAFYTGSTLPSGVSFPVTRRKLEQNSDLATGIGSAPANTMGWYHDLGTDAGTGIAERINVMPTVVEGVVGVAVNLPNGDACSPSGKSYEFAVGFADGKTVLSNTAAATAWANGVVTEIAFKNVGGTRRLYAGLSTGTIANVAGSFASSGTLKRLNWREVPTMN